jgi:hypothetical protein
VTIAASFFAVVAVSIAASPSASSSAALEPVGAAGTPALRAEPLQISQGARTSFEARQNPSVYRNRAGVSAIGAPALLAPPFDAWNFDTNGTVNGYYTIPPDNAAAAGPNNVVDAINVGIEWFSKTGTLQHRESLEDFFASLLAAPAGVAAADEEQSVFDPRVIYDQYSDRFVVVALDQTDTADGDPANTSHILLAVSHNSNPENGWYQTSIDSDVVDGLTHYWTDFPGVGVGSSAIYITGNLFSYGAGSGHGGRAWIVSKTGLYTGGAATVLGPYDPFALTGTSGAPVTLQPAQMFGTPPTNVGTFLAGYSGLSDVGGNVYVQVVKIENPITAPTFTSKYLKWGTGTAESPGPLPNAPQPLPSAVLINTGDRRVSSNAVWRSNNLYFAGTTVPAAGSDAAQATAHWWRVDTTTLASSSPTPADQGLVGGEAIGTGTFTYFPSVGVDASGNMAVGFSASGPTAYAGAYYSGRLAGDPAGTTQAASTLHAGVDAYYRTFLGTLNRWGDYSTTALDPDGGTIWLFNQYAMSRGTTLSCCPGQDGRWQTTYGRFSFAGSPPPPPAPPPPSPPPSPPPPPPPPPAPPPPPPAPPAPRPRAKKPPAKVTLCYRHHTVRVTKAVAKKLRKHGAKRGACKKPTKRR